MLRDSKQGLELLIQLLLLRLDRGDGIQQGIEISLSYRIGDWGWGSSSKQEVRHRGTSEQLPG